LTMVKKNIHPLQVHFHSLIDHIKIGSPGRRASSRKTSGRKASAHQPATGFAYVLGLDDRKTLEKIIQKHGPRWQQKQLKEQHQREMIHFSGVKGPVWIYARRRKKGAISHHARLEDSNYAWHRDQVGALLGYAKAYQIKKLNIQFLSTDEEQELGVLVGLDLAAYSYKNLIEAKGLDEVPVITIEKSGDPFNRALLKKAKAISSSTNLARHLVNTPPNYLNPTTFAAFMKKHFPSTKSLRLEIWNEQRLKKEGMGLHLGVGQGSENPPCLIHLRYRVPSKKEKQKPIAFVGKGVTFDTGGLDLKPSSNMRLMKKDMGGVAALAGLAQWLSSGFCEMDCDLYFGLAENSVDAKSMRPSDVLIARNGMKVEVHNTDAEGRLVLADVLDVAVTQKNKDEPQMIVDVATLTGAIKAGLGAEIAGLFSNHDGLAEELNRAGTQMGELNWRMPLYSKYNVGTDTPFADIANCVDGFGGAVTAALFLEKFVKEKPWAHLDIYAWNDRPKGALSFAGGSGQSVQTLIQFLLEKGME